jgi:hypothetical protein
MSYLNSGGLVHLFETCNYCSNFNFDEINSDEEKIAKNTLITVLLGCLHNVTNENGKIYFH